MAYCITDPSVVPRNCPLFDPVWDGPEPSRDPLDDRKAKLEECFPLGPDTKPSSTVLPLKAICCTAHKALPDFFGVCGRICISGAFKAIIDQLEPGAHQFFPAELQKKNKDPFEGQYFLFNILKIDESVIYEKSELYKMPVTPTHWFISTHGLRRTMDATKITGHHFWRERIYLRDIYISDEAMRLFKANKLRGFDYTNHAKVSLEIE